MNCVSDLKRIQVNMSRELRDALRSLAGELNIALDTDEIGTGSAAAGILEVLVANPDLMRQLKKRVLDAQSKKRRPPRSGEDEAA